MWGGWENYNLLPPYSLCLQGDYYDTMHSLLFTKGLINILGIISGHDGTLVRHWPAALWTRVQLHVKTMQIDRNHDF